MPLNTLFIGQNAMHLKAVGSTNTYATEMLRQISVPEGSVFYTFEQTNGRGQRENNWESEPNKNVALSLVLLPNFLNVEDQFLLTKITSLAMADLMSELLNDSAVKAEVKIKWPNDIYVNEKKIAGILIENNLRDDKIQSSIIGVGININQEKFSERILNVSSLKSFTNKEFDAVDVMNRFFEMMEVRYLQLRRGDVEKINADYLNCLYRRNEWKNFSSENKPFEGKILNVSRWGKLIMEMRDGVQKEFDLKELIFS